MEEERAAYITDPASKQNKSGETEKTKAAEPPTTPPLPSHIFRCKVALGVLTPPNARADALSIRLLIAPYIICMPEKQELDPGGALLPSSQKVRELRKSDHLTTTRERY